MAWIQVGTKKINTAVVDYIEQAGDSLKIRFNSGGELDLAGAEAAGFWKILKAENALATRDAGSTTTLPKYSTASVGSSAAVHKPQVQSSSSSHSHGQSHSSHPHSSHSHHSHASSSVAVKKH